VYFNSSTNHPFEGYFSAGLSRPLGAGQTRLQIIERSAGFHRALFTIGNLPEPD
jgi:hypothetical protein